MNFKDILHFALMNKKTMHRVAPNTKRGRQLTSAKGAVMVPKKEPNLRDIDFARDNRTIQGVVSKRDI